MLWMLFFSFFLEEENPFKFSCISSFFKFMKTWLCREGENFIFWFGAQFNSTLNFNQSGWLILFTPDLSFPVNKSGKLPNPRSLAKERRPVQTSHWPFFNSDAFLAGQRRPVQTSHCGSKIAAAATWIHEGTHLIYEFLTRNPSWI